MRASYEISLRIAAIVAASGCDAVLRLQQIPDVEPPLAGYTYRKPITIMQTTSATLPDFPVSILTTGDSDLVTHAMPDGSDLVFADGANVLPSELSEYTAGSLAAWVRVAELPPGATTIYLYYGGPARTGDPRTTWADPFRGVWHDERADASERDSSSHSLDLSSQGSTIAKSVQGIAGQARMFPGFNAQQLCVPDDPALDFDGASSMSYSLWLSMPSTAPLLLTEPLHKGGSSAPGAGYDFELASMWQASVSDTSSQTSVPLGAPRTDSWVQIAAVVDRSAEQIIAYVDGAKAATTDIHAIGTLTSNAPLCIGGDSDGTNAFIGGIDEIRIYAGAVTPEWIRFEYDNLGDRGNVISVGTEQKLR